MRGMIYFRRHERLEFQGSDPVVDGSMDWRGLRRSWSGHAHSVLDVAGGNSFRCDSLWVWRAVASRALDAHAKRRLDSDNANRRIHCQMKKSLNVL